MSSFSLIAKENKVRMQDKKWLYIATPFVMVFLGNEDIVLISSDWVRRPCLVVYVLQFKFVFCGWNK